MANFATIVHVNTRSYEDKKYENAHLNTVNVKAKIYDLTDFNKISLIQVVLITYFYSKKWLRLDLY